MRGIDVGQVAAASHAGGDIALFAGGGDRLFEIFADMGIGREIAVDELLGFCAGYAEEAFGETEGGDAVDDAEVCGFCAPALVVGNLGERYAVDFRGGDAVDVVARQEAFDHVLVGREVCDEAQFDLRIVGAHDHVAGIGDECATDFAPVVGTGWEYSGDWGWSTICVQWR